MSSQRPNCQCSWWTDNDHGANAVDQGAPEAIDLTPAWIDPKTYKVTLHNVAEDADKLREYLKK